MNDTSADTASDTSFDWKIDAELRSILVCPACRGELEDRPSGLACVTCSLLYPVVNDVPYMIRAEAKRL